MEKSIQKKSFWNKYLIGGLAIIAILLIVNQGEKVSIDEKIHQIILECNKKESFNYICFKKDIQTIIETIPTHKIITSLEKEFTHNQTTNPSTCHGPAHIVGELVVKKNTSISEIISSCSTKCDYGCIHGGLIEILKSQSNLRESIPTLCEQNLTPPYSQKDLDACNHAIGHAFAEIYAPQINTAYDLCESITSTNGSNECNRGTSMEYLLGSPENPSRYNLIDDFISYCHSLPTSSQKYCREYLGFYSYPIVGLEKSISICNDISVISEKKNCFSSLGSVLYFSFRDDLEGLIKSCSSANTYQADCIKGAIEVFVGEDEYAESAKILCTMLNEDQANDCNQHLQNRLEWAHAPVSN